MLDRVAVLAAAPVTSLLALLFELLLSFGVGEAETEFDASALTVNAVELSDDMLCDVTGFESKISAGESHLG